MDRLLQNESDIGQKILEQRLTDITNEKEKFQLQIKDMEETLAQIKELSFHPRHTSLVPISKLVYIEATTSSSEYLVRHGDYKSLTSQQQTYDYLDNVIKVYKENEDQCSKEIEQLEQRLMYLTEFRNQKVEKTDKGFTFQRDGLVEIIEVEAEPCLAKERVAKFKTAAERQQYLKSKR